MQRLLIALLCLAGSVVATSSAQSDLDALMARVLERRDENWKKLQQYTLHERETLQITGLAVVRLYGFDREYLWFPREGFFVRSPLKADGVTINEQDRREAEDRWLRRSQNREKRRAARTSETAGEDTTDDHGHGDVSGGVEDIVRQSFEPEFIRSANFLKFKFEAGQYGLVGRERMLDRDVLKIEYYPKQLFREDRKRRTPEAASRRAKQDDDKLEDQLNKVSLVTLWVDPTADQILRYEFRNIDLDFLPLPSLVRIDGLRATMQMGEPFPEVWLPAEVSMRFRMRLAAGPFEGRYDLKYTDYRLPTVTVKVQ